MSIRRSRHFSDDDRQRMITECNNNGRTALHLAAENGCLEYVSEMCIYCDVCMLMYMHTKMSLEYIGNT